MNVHARSYYNTQGSSCIVILQECPTNMTYKIKEIPHYTPVKTHQDIEICRWPKLGVVMGQKINK